MRKPRPFSHSPIYIDARRDRLAAIEQQARSELGMQATTDGRPADRLRGAFSSQATARGRRSVFRNTTVMIFLMVVFLVLAATLLYM